MSKDKNRANRLIIVIHITERWPAMCLCIPVLKARSNIEVYIVAEVLKARSNIKVYIVAEVLKARSNIKVYIVAEVLKARNNKYILSKEDIVIMYKYRTQKESYRYYHAFIIYLTKLIDKLSTYINLHYHLSIIYLRYKCFCHDPLF